MSVGAVWIQCVRVCHMLPAKSLSTAWFALSFLLEGVYLIQVVFVRSVRGRGVTALRRFWLGVPELGVSLLILVFQEEVSSLVSSYVSIYLLFFKPSARVGVLRGGFYSLQDSFLSFHLFLIAALILADDVLDMRFKPVIKPSFALPFNFVGVKVNKDASGYAFSVTQAHNLVPLMRVVVFSSHCVNNLTSREAADEGPVSFLEEHSQAQAMHPDSAHPDDQV